MSASTPYERSDAEHRGPPLLVLAIVSTVLFVGSIATTAIMTQGGHLPSPYDPTNGAVAFFSEHADAMCVNAFLQLGAAIVLGLFAATAVSRLRFLGVTAAGATIALFGGVAGSVFAASSALVQWVLASMDPTTLPIMSSGFHWLYFALGGPGHVAFTGLLVAGGAPSALDSLVGPRPRRHRRGFDGHTRRARRRVSLAGGALAHVRLDDCRGRDAAEMERGAHEERKSAAPARGRPSTPSFLEKRVS
jgi:hypothetical protein